MNRIASGNAITGIRLNGYAFRISYFLKDHHCVCPRNTSGHHLRLSRIQTSRHSHANRLDPPRARVGRNTRVRRRFIRTSGRQHAGMYSSRRDNDQTGICAHWVPENGRKESWRACHCRKWNTGGNALKIGFARTHCRLVDENGRARASLFTCTFLILIDSNPRNVNLKSFVSPVIHLKRSWSAWLKTACIVSGSSPVKKRNN